MTTGDNLTLYSPLLSLTRVFVMSCFVLNVNGLHDSYYNEGIQMTLKNIRIDTVKTEGSTVDHIEVKGNDKKGVY